jgi:hypothetical protein
VGVAEVAYDGAAGLFVGEVAELAGGVVGGGHGYSISQLGLGEAVSG